MKRILAAIFMISVFLIAGCAREAPISKVPSTSSGADAKVTITGPATPDTSTEAEVSNVESDLDNLNFDEGFDTDLDTLDKDLNFDI